MAKIEVINPTNHSVDVGEGKLLEPREIRKVENTEYVQTQLAEGELALAPDLTPAEEPEDKKKPAAKTAASQEGGS